MIHCKLFNSYVYVYKSHKKKNTDMIHIFQCIPINTIQKKCKQLRFFFLALLFVCLIVCFWYLSWCFLCGLFLFSPNTNVKRLNPKVKTSFESSGLFVQTYRGSHIVQFIYFFFQSMYCPLFRLTAVDIATYLFLNWQQTKWHRYSILKLYLHACVGYYIPKQ